MYSYRTLVLFPKIDDYSSIHEWPLITMLQSHSTCMLQAYHNVSELGSIMHRFANTSDTRIILIFGTDTEWHFLHQALAHHSNCKHQETSAPFHFYARMNAYTHILGLTPTNKNCLPIAEQSLSAYYHALAPRTLHALSLQLGTSLNHTHLTISCAESCTGGFIAKTLTDIAGASTYFYGGACTYTAEAKTQVLQVSENIISEKGIVSKETAEAMAIGAQRLFATDIALSTTGVAGPGPDVDGNPEGLVYCCIAINNDRYTYRYLASNETICTDRDFIRADCVRFIFEKLLTHLHAL